MPGDLQAGARGLVEELGAPEDEVGAEDRLDPVEDRRVPRQRHPHRRDLLWYGIAVPAVQVCRAVGRDGHLDGRVGGAGDGERALDEVLQRGGGAGAQLRPRHHQAVQRVRPLLLRRQRRGGAADAEREARVVGDLDRLCRRGGGGGRRRLAEVPRHGRQHPAPSPRGLAAAAARLAGSLLDWIVRLPRGHHDMILGLAWDVHTAGRSTFCVCVCVRPSVAEHFG